MKKFKYQILFIILLMTIGLAAVTSNLVINGNTSIASNPDDFIVYFSDAKIDGVQDLSLVDSETSLVFNKELNEVGQSIVITYDITNASKNYDADVNITCSQSTEYLRISNNFDTTSNLSARATRSGTLTITLFKSYAGEEEVIYDTTCTINASAVERTTAGATTVPDGVVGYYPMLATTYEFDRSAFRSNEYREKITKVSFEDEINIPVDAVETWDISHHQDGSVMAYVVENDDYYINEEDWEEYDDAYDLVIQSNGKVYGNKDMSYWFSYMKNLKSLFNIENMDTISVNNMSHMFNSTGFIVGGSEFNLDLSSFDTSNVTDMSYMFYQTGYNSTKLNFSITIKNPNTSSYSGMFESVAIQSGSQIIVNYTSQTSDLVDLMIATKSEESNVIKGVQVD